jgi:hypothetical protein
MVPHKSLLRYSKELLKKKKNRVVILGPDEQNFLKSYTEFLKTGLWNLVTLVHLNQNYLVGGNFAHLENSGNIFIFLLL